MSFSGKVKEELVKQTTNTRHCQAAEMAALMIFGNALKIIGEKAKIDITEESTYGIRKLYLLLYKNNFIAEKYTDEELNELSSICFSIAEKKIQELIQFLKYDGKYRTVHPLLIQHSCCQRAYLRGAFLAIGSMSNPEKGYHLEFVCDEEKQAEQIKEVLKYFQIHGKIVQRKKYYVVYLKESEEIVELLNVMGAHIALMELENLRILKDMRNSINRRVNCEAANIHKTVSAATKQIEDILLIQEKYGFENLSDQLREMAGVRLDYPDASLKELGEYLEPKVGKSGVNHRLRKLGEIAEKLRES